MRSMLGSSSVRTGASVMKASELKARYLQLRPDGFFFTRNNMKHSGDTMANYRCQVFRHGFLQYVALIRKQRTPKGADNTVYFRWSDMSHSTVHPEEREPEQHTRKLKSKCPACGGAHIAVSASAYWNEKAQEWSDFHVESMTAECSDCDHLGEADDFLVDA